MALGPACPRAARWRAVVARTGAGVSCRTVLEEVRSTTAGAIGATSADGRAGARVCEVAPDAA